MVAIEEVIDHDETASQERLWDAEEIEGILSQLKRPTAKMQVESLVKKIRKEASALKAIEKTTRTSGKTEALAPSVEPVKKAPPTEDRKPIPIPATAVSNSSPSTAFNSIEKFAFDVGTSSDKFVTLYLPLPGVGALKAVKDEKISCFFGKDSLDLKVHDLEGKNYRLVRDNLEHEIDPENSKYILKKDKIVLKLQKKKKEYGGYDYWSKLTDPKKGDKKTSGSKGSGSDDPSASIMNMMKDMYNSGDDNMKKIIGETMLKQRNGELNNDKPNFDSGMGDF